MKYKALFIFLLCLGGTCFAQGPQAGTFYVYDEEALQAQTPAPEGYAPFYISHFGRHGARYCTSEYENLYKLLEKAAEKDLLTDDGKAFLGRYRPFYEKVRLSRGNLTGVGKAQHQGIAERMYRRFPDVFEGPTHVNAVSTESARVIMSMGAFLSTLQGLDKDIDIAADASAKYGWWLQPSISSNPNLVKDAFSVGKEADAAWKEYFRSMVPWKEITEKFFTGADVLEKELGSSPQRFIGTLNSVVSGTWCLDSDKGCFDDVFTEEQAALVWKASSARYFMEVARFDGSKSMSVDYAAYTLGQIIETADADIASGALQLRLRFGHDSGIAPLMAILDLNGMGRRTSSFEESLEIFPNYKVPMAATIQLVFYRNAGGNILVKVLLNEEEAALPFQAVEGPYYSWDDFKAYFTPEIREAKRKISISEPLAALKAVDWGWRPVDGSKVEVGGASVPVFNSVQSISIARFPLWEQSVSVVESDGPKAAVTSTFGKNSQALAAINGSYFNKEWMPVTFVKDEGRVVNAVTTDGGTRCNGMLRIKDKRGRKIDILGVDSLSVAKSAQGWREAIVSGPVLLEDGVPVIYEDDGSREFRRFYARRHPRTIIGYTADGWVYFIVVDGRFPSQADGMSIAELEVLCESLGLYEALNLDGGGSSALWAKDAGVLNHPYDNLVFDHEGERVVPNAIIVK